MMTITSFSVGPMDNRSYLITQPDGPAVLVDAPPLTAELKAAVLSFRPTLLLLTHRHYDHILGAAQLREMINIQIAIGEKDACGLYDTSASQMPGFGTFCGVSQTPVQADRLLRDGDIVTAGALEIRVLETPGHTVGGVCFLCGGSLFSGDTLFAGDIGATAFPTGSRPDMRRSLDRLLSLPENITVYPGHGDATTIAAERAGNPYRNGGLEL